MVATCIFLLPAGLSANDGISYYAVFQKTTVPYFLSLLLPAYFSLRFAINLSKSKPYILPRAGFIGLAILLGGLALIPYNQSGLSYELHTGLGATLFLTEIALCAWLVLSVRWDTLNAILLILIALAGIASGLYLRPAAGLLLQSQLIFQLFFAIILIRSATSLDRLRAI